MGVMDDGPDVVADELEAAIKGGRSLVNAFVSRRGQELVEFLRDAAQALEEGDWG